MRKVARCHLQLNQLYECFSWDIHSSVICFTSHLLIQNIKEICTQESRFNKINFTALSGCSLMILKTFVYLLTYLSICWVKKLNDDQFGTLICAGATSFTHQCFYTISARVQAVKMPNNVSVLLRIYFDPVNAHWSYFKKHYMT